MIDHNNQHPVNNIDHLKNYSSKSKEFESTLTLKKCRVSARHLKNTNKNIYIKSLHVRFPISYQILSNSPEVKITKYIYEEDLPRTIKCNH